MEKLMAEKMREGNPDEDDNVDQTNSGLEEEGDTTVKKPPVTGSRLWDRVRSSLLKPKVKRKEVRTEPCAKSLCLVAFFLLEDLKGNISLSAVLSLLICELLCK